MNETPENEGLLARLRANESINKVSRGRPDLIIFGAPAALLAIIVVAAIGGFALFAGGGGDGDDEQASGATATPEATETISPQTTPTQTGAGLITPIPVSPGDMLSASDLAAREPGAPGRGPFVGERLIIPSIGVDAPFSIKAVPSNGAMPNPNGPEDVAWYDFTATAKTGLGGAPTLGGNVVLAGHVDYINHGPAVFWDIRGLEAGEIIQIRTTDGQVLEYQVEFNKIVPQGWGDWPGIVQATADESITLITCTGEFSGGHYSNRQIVWGRRIA